MQDFRNLLVWQKAHQLTLAIYEATQRFPREEMHGLISQMRRSSASIPSNLAEGVGRDSDGELARFSNIAMGSAAELEYQLLLAHDLGYLDSESYGRLQAELEQVRRMLNAFVRKLRSK